MRHALLALKLVEARSLLAQALWRMKFYDFQPPQPVAF
jgi:hypothetical protein